MLRLCLVFATGLLFVLSLSLACFVSAVSFWLPVVWFALFLACLLFERVRYKHELAAPPGPDWLATEECSVDESGLVRVWFHPRSGERAYVREQSGGR